MPFTMYAERSEHESAKQFVYRILRRNILLLDMIPGEPISEKDIAARLNLSRTPVREALMELCRERLVEIYPQRGTRVALMDAQLVNQGRFLRETVESAVLELACGNLPVRHIEQLERNLDEQEQERIAGDVVSFFVKDNEFHRIIFDACGKGTVYDAIGFYLPHFIRERMLCPEKLDTRELLDDHRGILEAIKQDDCEAAKLHLANHLEHVACDQSILKKAYPHYFRHDQRQ